MTIHVNEYPIHVHVHIIQGGPKKTNTETNQNDTYTNDFFGIYTITICRDIK